MERMIGMKGKTYGFGEAFQAAMLGSIIENEDDRFGLFKYPDGNIRFSCFHEEGTVPFGKLTEDTINMLMMDEDWIITDEFVPLSSQFPPKSMWYDTN